MTIRLVNSNVNLARMDFHWSAVPDLSGSIRLPLYDMPMSKNVRHLRMVFLVNMFCSTAISLWVRTEDVYTLLAAAAIMTAGFIPLAIIQILYGQHIRSIRILNNLNKRDMMLAKRDEALGISQVEYPVNNETPLLIEQFSLFGRDPKTAVYVHDLTPGPSRRYSISWKYKPQYGSPVTFRVSKKIVQFHPDIRALDTLIRENAALGITAKTTAKQANKLRKMARKNEKASQS
ncbi:hypothetical protein GGI07_002662 [Coemansia sp. Benny D115]|nr:hypothetical protein GGI07_002662 [Coemansia sp. Benny D115]